MSSVQDLVTATKSFFTISKGPAGSVDASLERLPASVDTTDGIDITIESTDLLQAFGTEADPPDNGPPTIDGFRDWLKSPDLGLAHALLGEDADYDEIDATLACTGG